MASTAFQQGLKDIIMGEYEPDDSRNVTGTASTPDGRWTNKDGKPPVGVPDAHPADADDARVADKGIAAKRSLSDETAVADADETSGKPRSDEERI